MNGMNFSGRSTAPWMRWFELGMVLLIAGWTLAAASLPWIWGERAQRLEHNPDKVWTSTLETYADDATSYWSWMRQARDGRFLFTDLYTPDEHPRNYVNIFFWGLGKASAVTGLELTVVYHLARVTLGAILLLLLYLLARRMFLRPGERIACFFLMVVTGGWEGISGYMERNHAWGHITSPGWWTPEMSTYFSLMLFPHFLAGFIAMVAVLLLLLGPWTDTAMSVRRQRIGAVAAGGVMFLLTFFHPYDVIPIMGAVWTAPLLMGAVARRLPWRQLQLSALATAVWVPALLYNLYIFRSNPAMRAWDLQNIMITPEVGRLFIALGLTGLLSLVAILGLKSLREPHLVMVGWLLSTLTIIHLPLRFQRRTIGGIQFATGVLAVAAIVCVLLPIVRRLLKRRTTTDTFGWGVLGITLLMVPVQVATPYYIQDIERGSLGRVDYPSWLLVEEYRALHRLEDLLPAESVVLSSYEIGNFIPPYSGHRCIIGHYALTIDAKEKEAAVARFFGMAGDAWRLQFLRRWSVGYLVHSRYERQLGSFDPATRPWLELLYSEGEDPERRVEVYAVRLDAAAAAPSPIPSP
jgi:hypothetical protein